MSNSALVTKPEFPASCKDFCHMVFMDKFIKRQELTPDHMHQIVHSNEHMYYDSCPGSDGAIAVWLNEFRGQIA